MSWIERAQVGDKVVCIDATPNLKALLIGIEMPLVEGRIYEISEINPLPRIHVSPGIEVRGIRSGALYGFNHERFRPAHNTSRQVEALKRLCLQSPEAVE